MNATNLRKLFNQPDKLITLAGAHDALSARLVQEADFDGIWASGLEISTAHGVADAGILTLTEMLDTSRLIAESVSIPVISDCDSGFGDTSHACRMVRKFEAAGVAAVCIEDAEFPKRNSLAPGEHPLASIEDFSQKIRAAKHVQRDPDFMVIARVEALIARQGQREALRRAHAYSAAGADAILIHSSAPSPDEILEFIQAWDGSVPLVLVPTTYHSISTAQIRRSNKVKMVVYANHGTRAIIPALRKVFRQIRLEGSTHNAEQRICSLPELLRLNGIVAERAASTPSCDSERLAVPRF